MEDVEDPLKSLSTIFEYDRPFLTGEIEDFHADLSSVTLDTSIDVDVRQLFETAKNVALYSRFVYRFHQVAESVGFGALELTLKRLHSKLASGKTPIGLGRLLRWAFDAGFLDTAYFGDHLDDLTKSGIRKERKRSADKLRDAGQVSEDPNRPITKDDMQDGLTRNLGIHYYIGTVSGLRNNLSHGSTMLVPGSISSLRRTADLINHINSNAQARSIIE
tara:strand:+ start:45186 stop:45842 length:657 start_codon:yes stop_codon:yes gene_type:complete